MLDSCIDCGNDNTMFFEEKLTVPLKQTNEIVEYLASHSFVTTFNEE